MQAGRRFDNGYMAPNRIRLDPQTVDAVARRVVEILEERGLQQRELVDAGELARQLGVERSWIYTHAIELGAVKLRMRTQAKGEVIERDRKAGRTFALRFRAYGKRRYLTLGTVAEGWSRAKAEEELSNVLADVRRGIWRPHEPQQRPEPKPEQTFHEFASEWLYGLESEGLSENTLKDLHLAARQAPVAVLRTAPALGDHDHRGRSLPAEEGPRRQALGNLNQQHLDPAGADPRGRSRARANRPKPGEGEAAAVEAAQARADISRPGRADRRLAGGGGRARRGSPSAEEAKSKAKELKTKATASESPQEGLQQAQALAKQNPKPLAIAGAILGLIVLWRFLR